MEHISYQTFILQQPALRLWPSHPLENCPFPLSVHWQGLAFTGRYRSYTHADTWYLSWASDGNCYSAYADGVVDDVSVSSGRGDSAMTGNAVVHGQDPLNLTVQPLTPCTGSALPYGGRYPSANLVHNGIWYHGTYCLAYDPELIPFDTFNWDILGPFVGFNLSNDMGKTWTMCPHTPEKPLFGEHVFDSKTSVRFGSPHMVDFGRNMQYSPDGKAYLVAHGSSVPRSQARPANNSWISGDQVYLARVIPSPETINDPTAYEFFAGYDNDGQPIWSTDFAAMHPLLNWPGHMGCVTCTYHPGLQRYLMCVTDGWPTTHTMNTYVLEAETLTGPWRMVTFMERFGEQAYFVNIPAKFIDPADPTRLFLCYSTNFVKDHKRIPIGGKYGMVLQEAILMPKNSVLEKDFLWDPQNIARIAQVITSSSHPDSHGGRVADGSVGTPDAEWWSDGECEGAFVRFDWGWRGIECGCIWIVPSADPTHRIANMRIRFSTGAVINTGQLPTGTDEALEITFLPILTKWMLIQVTAVVPETTSAGLAEVAVFHTSPREKTQ